MKIETKIKMGQLKSITSMILIFAGLYVLFKIELSLIPKTDKSFHSKCDDLCSILRATLLSSILYTVILFIG